MIIALTGTPGTGKTSVAEGLKSKGFIIIDLNKIACDKGFLTGKDEKRNSNIVDIKKFDRYIIENYTEKENLIVEGHLSHLLGSVEKIILLRCHPEILKKNLSRKGWNQEKIKENIEAEILDIILCEAVEFHNEKNIFEIDVTSKTVEEVVSIIIEIFKNKFKNIKEYKIGKIDWSEEILKDF